MALLEQRLSQIDDGQLREFAEELCQMRRIPLEDALTLRQVLLQVFHPAGPKKRHRIDKSELNPAGILILRVKDCQGGVVFQLCRELIGRRAGSLESYVGKCVYMILNEFGPDLTERKKRPIESAYFKF